MRNHQSIIVISLLLIACMLPAAAVTTYLTDGPVMSAAISGSNEFSAGQDAVITVVVLNSGTNIDKFVMDGTIDRDDAPTTAKMVTVGIEPGPAPVIVKSDPQNIGDIPSQGKATAKISAKITADATEGEYSLPVSIRYTHRPEIRQEVADYLQNKYNTTTVMVPLTIKIKPQVRIEVVEVTADKLTVGTGGYVTLKIRNLGFEDGKKATVRLLRSGTSPVIPSDSSVFIGDFPRDGVVTCRYKVSVSSEAEKQTYPVDVAVTYENREGDVVTSARDTIGLVVGDKVSFTATPESVAVTPGSTDVIVVRYTNTGDIPVYAAQARLSAVEPFTSSDNTAYLGDLQPGESATARFALVTGNDAEVREYELDTEVRYRDAHENSQMSDTFRVPVRVNEKPAFAALAGMLPFILLIVLIVAGAGYYYLVMKKKK